MKFPIYRENNTTRVIQGLKKRDITFYEFLRNTYYGTESAYELNEVQIKNKIYLEKPRTNIMIPLIDMISDGILTDGGKNQLTSQNKKATTEPLTIALVT
jgi:hypothetical protein